jgi:hypothetical protein
MRTSTGYVYFNPKTIRYLTTSLGTGWSTKKTKASEVDEIDDAEVFMYGHKHEPEISRYISENKLVELEVTITRIIELVE